jgi:hypothetical protein
MYELSLVELESELSTALPSRELMCARRRRKAKKHASSANNGTSANNGSVANSNSTSQSISNAQTVAATGVNVAGNGGNGGVAADTIPALGGIQANGALAFQLGADNNSNSNLQYGTPVNYAG